jgi:hypothetical protein
MPPVKFFVRVPYLEQIILFLDGHELKRARASPSALAVKATGGDHDVSCADIRFGQVCVDCRQRQPALFSFVAHCNTSDLSLTPQSKYALSIGKAFILNGLQLILARN